MRYGKVVDREQEQEQARRQEHLIGVSCFHHFRIHRLCRHYFVRASYEAWWRSWLTRQSFVWGLLFLAQHTRGSPESLPRLLT